jgi:hypothetical protein
MNIYKPLIFDILNKITVSNDFKETAQKQIAPIHTNTNQLQHFQQQAKAAYKKYFVGKRTLETESNYLLCWYDSMKEIMSKYNITQQQIFKETKQINL